MNMQPASSLASGILRASWLAYESALTLSGGWTTCDRFTSHDSNPKKSAGKSIVLSLGSDVVDPSHDPIRQNWVVTNEPGLRGGTEGTFVKSLDDVHKTHERQNANHQHTTWIIKWDVEPTVYEFSSSSPCSPLR